MSDEDPTLPRLISPSTDEVTALQIKKSRVATASRMATLGAPQVNQNLETLANLVNDSDAALMQTYGRKGESLQDIQARIDSDDHATDRERQFSNASRSSRLSYETELNAKRNMATDFETENYTNEVEELKHSFETAMATEINRVSKKWDINRMAAKDLVDQDVAVRGQAVVLPIYHRIYSRFAAKYPDEIGRAEAGE